MKIAILGAGAWGTALAAALAGRLPVSLWARDEGQARAIASARCNLRYLPEIALPESLEVTADLDSSLSGAALVVLAAPVSALRSLAQDLHARQSRVPFVWLCKGFEAGRGLLPH